MSSTETKLSEQTVKRIEEEAKVYVNTNFPPDIGGTLKTYLRACYQGAATAEATRSQLLLEALEKYIEFLDLHLGRTSQMAMIHGYTFSKEDIDKGIEFREKIRLLKLASYNNNNNHDNA